MERLIMKFASALGLMAVAVMTAGALGADVKWVCTTAGEPWKVQAAPAVVDSGEADVVVKTKAALQTVDGFGGCFNELGWEVLLPLPEEERGKVMKALFGDEGCGFTLARMPIGASDYGREWYSLDDTPGDLALEKFNIDRDKGYMLKYVKEAMAVRPELGVWISAWSPPAWMKDNNKMNGGHLKQDPETLKAYAKYLAKAVQAYQGEGLKIYAIMPQNEPRSNSNYPTCVWNGAQIRDFIRDYMGPVLKEEKVTAEIWAGTFNDSKVANYIEPIMADEKAAAYVTGVAYQWEGKDAIVETHRRWPNLKLMQSENECRSGADSFADAEYTFGLMRRYFNGGASSYFYWNMVLKPRGRSTWGWNQNSMITVKPDTKEVVYNPEFYLFKHLSHFVRPGSKMATTEGTVQEKLGFVGKDGSAIVVLGNPTTAEKAVTIGTDLRPGLVKVTLPAHSISTLVVPAN
jgi:glucosylceramidase